MSIKSILNEFFRYEMKYQTAANTLMAAVQFDIFKEKRREPKIIREKVIFQKCPRFVPYRKNGQKKEHQLHRNAAIPRMPVALSVGSNSAMVYGVSIKLIFPRKNYYLKTNKEEIHI